MIGADLMKLNAMISVQFRCCASEDDDQRRTCPELVLERSPTDERPGFAGVLLPLLLLLIALVVPVASQNGGPAGLSIDCGSEANYTDTSGTGIHWVTDGPYIRTGRTQRNLRVQSNGTIVNSKQSQSMRYFDEGRDRDCYVLPVEPQNTYLVRPTFYYGDWISPANVTAFDVYLDANNWLTFRFEQDTLKTVTYVYEALVYVTRRELDVCLVRHQGTPFISALELRLLESGMYSSVLAGRKFMAMGRRYNYGTDTVPPFLRYPEDDYDRIWYNRETNLNLSTTADLTILPNLTPERPPLKVMQTARYGDGDLTYTLTFHNRTVGPMAVYSYFQEVAGNASYDNSRSMNYYVNGIRIDAFNSSSQPYEVGSGVLTEYGRVINITVTNTSSLPAILNAFEIYYVHDWNGTTTNGDDVKSIGGVQNQLNLTDWTGDPCIPKPYGWLTCSSAADQEPTQDMNNQTSGTVTLGRTSYVTGLSLENIAIQTLPPELANISRLTFLNLSNTGLARLPPAGVTVQNLTILDLSSNRFSGSALEFIQTINVSSLQGLYAANNSLEGEFPIKQLYAQFPDLDEASFDNNPNITGTLDLSSWHVALQSSVQNDAANASTTSTPAPATGRTAVATPARVGIPLVYLRNNGIRGITPSLDELSSDINRYLRDLERTGSNAFLHYGVLLGGNPWCQEKEFSAQSLPQQYLCRDYPTQYLPGLAGLFPSKNTNNLGGIIGGVVGGIALLVACVALVAIWRLWRRSSSLKEVQEALARQKVQPPFYAYSDLKAATNEFGPENKLGQGTFGDVYKGTLLDGKDGRLELVAVKRLYPSQQALTEFLNEAVLITGIKHRNLVQLKGCCIHKEDQRMLVYEFAENGNLAEALWDKSSNKDAENQEKTTLDWQQRLNVCVGIARGLSYLHEELQPRIIHRDIKPYNILMDKNFNAKIADFGLARSVVEGQAEADFTLVAGTKGYFAPEYATQGQLSEKADVFSFGVVLLEIVSGRKCIDSRLPGEKQFLQVWARRVKEEGKLLELLDPAIQKTADSAEVIRVINLAFLCLDFYPERRPTMSQAVTMLQGIMDVTLYTPDESDQPTYRPRDPHVYTKLPPLSEDHPSESFDISSAAFDSSATSSAPQDLELGKLSGR